MKLPGIGEVKKPWLYGEGIAVVAVFGYGYIKSRRATAAQNTNSGNTQDAIDPTTDLPYSQESGVYGFGGVDPNTGVPFIYEQQNQAPPGSGQQLTSNSAWLSQAEQDAQNIFGATYSLSSSALGKYIAQSPSGLQDDEYQLVSEVVAELGQPPVNGPFRLIHAQQPVTNPSSNPPATIPGTPVIANPPPVVQGSTPAPRSTTVTVVPFGNPAPWNSTMWGIANHFGISLSKLEAANPQVRPPDYVIHPGQKITVPY